MDSTDLRTTLVADEPYEPYEPRDASALWVRIPGGPGVVFVPTVDGVQIHDDAAYLNGQGNFILHHAADFAAAYAWAATWITETLEIHEEEARMEAALGI